VDLFVMSECPYGVEAISSMREVLGALGKGIDLDVHYIADAKEDGTFQSLHGQSEVVENIRQLCAKKFYRKNNRYLDYLWCRAKDYQRDPKQANNWRKCAVKGISAKLIERCVQQEGPQLLRADIRLGQALRVSASPTWLANNKYSFSGIAAETIKTEICKHNIGLAGCEKALSKGTAPSAGSCAN
jgi:hypothetical protein